MVPVPDVVGDLSPGFLSLPANTIAPILFLDRWSNQPSSGGMDKTLFPGFVPMFQGTISLIWGFWDHIWGSWGRLWGSALKQLQYFESAHKFHSCFGGFHLISCMLLLVRDNYMLLPLQRTEGVVFRMVWFLLDMQVGLLFYIFEALMGFCIALCGGIPQVFRSPGVSIFSAAVVAAGVFRLRVISFCRGVTFGPLRVDSGFWAEPHLM
ncbi:hypothetical protein C1H46_027307 [Malus baccata]|uniref:Uncharacterized protein n=1 Tax=Malus baccata TaxID=106549 RepID=A0A540LL10_MALBA|nr:hypothetical protein C1H46_027307 [Malus baccata]